MTTRNRTIIAALSAAAAACTINGKPIGFGSSSAEADPAKTTGGTSGTSGTTTAKTGGKTTATTGCPVMRDDDAWPYLAKPVDPWRAVADGKPITVAHEGLAHSLAPGSAPCDAAHDHCMRECTWLVTMPAAGDPNPAAFAYHFMPDGTLQDHGDSNAQPGYTAYRSVPATKNNLAVGELVFAIKAPSRDAGGHNSTDGIDYSPLAAVWDVGTIESIDWDTGTLRMIDRHEAYFLSATRVPVLRYQEGGKVEAIKGVDATVPAVADVFQPGQRKRVTNDPWAQVDKAKQPIAVKTAPGPMTKFTDECTPETDHCLLPWVWFVDVGADRLETARWTGKGFVRAIDADSPITDPRLAYRTRPAKDAEIKVGTKLALFDSSDPPPSEYDVHLWRKWIIGTVTSVDRNARKFDVDGEATHYPMSNARIMVLYWLDGEKAAAVE